MRRRFPLVNALEFRCYTVIPLANQKLNFDDRISCFTRHDDFSPRSHRAVSLQVAPFLRDCKGRGYRRRAGLSLSLSYGLFRSIANNWHQYCKRIFRTHRLSHSTTMLPSNSFASLFISLQCCYHNDIFTVATFSFLRAAENWWHVGWIFGNQG